MRTLLYPEWIIDGTGAPPLTGHVVALADGRIDAVAPVSEFGVDADMLHLPSVTLLPGLINNHVHLILPADGRPFFSMNEESDVTLGLWAVHNAGLALRAGVTTVRDCGGRREIVLDTRAGQALGLFRGSRIVSCGWTITMTGGHTRNFGGEADGEVALRQMVRRLVSRGVDFIKVMASGGGTPGSLPAHPSYTVEELRVIVETAHGLGKTVTTHCTCTAAIANSVAAGVDFIEHAMFTRPDTPFGYDPRVAEALAQSGIWVTPTTQVNRDMVEQTPASPDRDLWARRLEAQQMDVARMRELGVRLLAGSDAGWRVTAFETFWKELDQLVVCGLTPVEAVHTATGRLSQALGLGHLIGTIQPGRLADLLLVDGNVAQDIRALSRVRAVYQAGELV